MTDAEVIIDALRTAADAYLDQSSDWEITHDRRCELVEKWRTANALADKLESGS